MKKGRMLDDGLVRVGLRVGAIGGAVAGAVALLNMLPGLQLCLTCTLLVLYLATFTGSGLLAAYWLTPPRNAGAGFRVGAIAGAVAGLGGGIVNVIVAVVRSALGDKFLTDSQTDSLVNAGLDPQVLKFLTGPLGSGITGSVCCLGGLVIAALLGAVGGVILTALVRG